MLTHGASGVSQAEQLHSSIKNGNVWFVVNVNRDKLEIDVMESFGLVMCFVGALFLIGWSWSMDWKDDTKE